ncbi:MAG TPA: Na+/H+ antiporter NhaC family protein [Halanaerobiales bacterium]|nr:Na+/H+ antiporter NhaC family protein [Halanaerobiales bacterium]
MKKINITFNKAIIPVISMIIFLILAVLLWDAPIHIPLIMELTFTLFLALYWGFKWNELEEMMFSSFAKIGNVLIIIMLIGMIIGIWIESGTVPTMIYYGLRFLRPQYFYVISFIFSSMVSIAIGTAFGTVSTVGLALISIAQGMGISLPLAAGSIISGAYVGDRMSPLSSIAILTAHSAESDLHDMIKEMLKTFWAPFVLSAIIYFILGYRYNGFSYDISQINLLLDGLINNYLISFFMLIPPLMIIILAIKRVPTILNLIINLILSSFIAFFVSGINIKGVIDTLYAGASGETNIALLNKLLTRGGLASMLDLVSLIILAVVLGGLLEKLGILNTILNKIIKAIDNRSQLISVTMASSFITAALSCNQLLGVFLPGKMLGSKYDELKVPRSILGRSLGDSGLILSPLIPWNINALMMMGILGVHTLEYFKYTFFPVLVPITGLILANFINRGGKNNE